MVRLIDGVMCRVLFFFVGRRMNIRMAAPSFADFHLFTRCDMRMALGVLISWPRGMGGCYVVVGG